MVSACDFGDKTAPSGTSRVTQLTEASHRCRSLTHTMLKAGRAKALPHSSEASAPPAGLFPYLNVLGSQGAQGLTAGIDVKFPRLHKTLSSLPPGQASVFDLIRAANTEPSRAVLRNAEVEGHGCQGGV